MKNIFFLFAFVLVNIQTITSQVSTASGKVLICKSTGATIYHSYRCSGLNQCTHSVSELTTKEAEELGRTACKICYKSASKTPTANPPANSYTPAPKSQGSG